jgi:vancomycin resistance protein VanW
VDQHADNADLRTLTNQPTKRHGPDRGTGPQRETTPPLDRPSWRLALGKEWYTLLRYWQWIKPGQQWAHPGKSAEPWQGAEGWWTYASHATPLLRQLKDVDMVLQQNKITNLRLAAACLDGVKLAPGERFSYWRLIGRPTRRRGFKSGMVLQNGQVRSGVGGGLCQLSNLIYWITIHTPLRVVERHRHNYDVFPDTARSQPFGSGATCFYNYGDLGIVNPTEQTFQLRIRLTADNLEGCWQVDTQPWQTYEVYEQSHRFRQELWGGYSRHNVLCRHVFTPQGELMADEFVVENHAIMMYNPLLEAG